MTDHERDEVYTVPQSEPCPNTRTVRFDVQTIELVGKTYQSEWSFLPERVWEAFEELIGVEFSPRKWGEHPRVTTCDVGHMPDDSHGVIVLEDETVHGPVRATFATEDDNDR